MVVVGRVTGTHIIEDINVHVPHMVPITITPEQMYRSKDLYRSLQQHRIFKLDCTPFRPESPPFSAPQDTARLKAVEQENRVLRDKLQKATAQKEGLAVRLEGMQKQLETVLTTLGRIEAAGPVVVHSGGKAVAAATEAVGGEAPTYIPDQIHPENAEARITTEEDTTEGTSVSDAASRLRKLRQTQPEDEDIDFG